ncbi:MAG: response regulator [Actinomycetota bacterium]
MAMVLLATDSDEIAEETFAALVTSETTVSRVQRGEDVREVALEIEPDLVILDLQIGNMGGVATSLDLRHEIAAGRLKPMKIMMLLDRHADLWIASEAKVDAELVKPLNALQLRKKAESLL